jgi:hypothetical protein
VELCVTPASTRPIREALAGDAPGKTTTCSSQVLPDRVGPTLSPPISTCQQGNKKTGNKASARKMRRNGEKTPANEDARKGRSLMSVRIPNSNRLGYFRPGCGHPVATTIVGSSPVVAWIADGCSPSLPASEDGFTPKGSALHQVAGARSRSN